MTAADDGQPLLPGDLITVTHPEDDGPGSLRAAILSANLDDGPVTISIDLPTDQVLLRPTSPLPPLTFAGILDGRGAELSGVLAGSGHGLDVHGGDLTIRDLVVTGWSENGVLVRQSDRTRLIGLVVSGNGEHGILVQTSADLRLEACRLGTTPDGLAALPNRGSGIKLYESHAAVIGGDRPGSGNLVSGNLRYGVEIGGIGSADAVIIGNLIGCDVTGSNPLPNNRDGLVVHSSPNVRIGGPTSSERNVISGNNLYGLEIIAPDARGAVIVGNYVGVSAAGDSPLPNGRSGILIYNAAFARIGGPGSGDGNVISGGSRAGINLDGSVREGYPWTGVGEAHSNLVQGNIIGLDATGERPLGNELRGVLVNHTQNNLVTENLIAGNGQDGILVLGPEDDSNPDVVSSGNRIVRNRIGVTKSGRPAGNGRHGVFVRHSKDNHVGSDDPADANLIAHSGIRGVSFSGTGARTNTLGENELRDNVRGPFHQPAPEPEEPAGPTAP
ncbi:right-handed parallel beta-helix repeat-containing protein [Nocardioides stalactiti]|uniref:right-handed parallel beta-helix repeat-containing protein n=1 Tax=Nocardioides stalactiti TaxID=2755356 RepID=UPI0016026E9B|nr:right-handed parallel beta-helix repeat-containing protein [Nocardioides stalactiti]